MLNQILHIVLAAKDNLENETSPETSPLQGLFIAVVPRLICMIIQMMVSATLAKDQVLMQLKVMLNQILRTVVPAKDSLEKETRPETRLLQDVFVGVKDQLLMQLRVTFSSSMFL